MKYNIDSVQASDMSKLAQDIGLILRSLRMGDEVEITDNAWSHRPDHVTVKFPFIGSVTLAKEDERLLVLAVKDEMGLDIKLDNRQKHDSLTDLFVSYRKQVLAGIYKRFARMLGVPAE